MVLSVRINTPVCPLCDKRMVEIQFKKAWWYVCHSCQISILTNDIFVGKWNDDAATEDGEDTNCPVCRAKMRVFMRSDGYAKCKCTSKTCGATIESDIPDEKFKFKVI